MEFIEIKRNRRETTKEWKRTREKEEVHVCCGRWKRRNWGCEGGEVGRAREGWGHRWVSWRGAHSPSPWREQVPTVPYSFFLNQYLKFPITLWLSLSLTTQTKHAHAARQKPSLRLLWFGSERIWGRIILYTTNGGTPFFLFSKRASIFRWKDLFTLSFLHYLLYFGT